MSTPISETLWLNETVIYSLDELIEISGLSLSDAQTLINEGSLIPLKQDTTTYQFHFKCLITAQKARRLRDDFELDLPAVSLVLKLLTRIDELEETLKRE